MLLFLVKLFFGCLMFIGFRANKIIQLMSKFGSTALDPNFDINCIILFALKPINIKQPKNSLTKKRSICLKI